MTEENTNRLVEVEEFGFDLIKGEIDGIIECPECDERISFVIRKDKIQSIIDAYNKNTNEEAEELMKEIEVVGFEEGELKIRLKNYFKQEAEIKRLKEEKEHFKKLSEYNLKKLKEEFNKDKEFKKELEKTITTMAKAFEDELYSKKKEELESYWHFKYEEQETTDWTYLYKFFEALKLYGNFCRRWEEHHNGSCCVVERVRDTYLKPKIEQLIQKIQEWRGKIK